MRRLQVDRLGNCTSPKRTGAWTCRLPSTPKSGRARTGNGDFLPTHTLHTEHGGALLFRSIHGGFQTDRIRQIRAGNEFSVLDRSKPIGTPPGIADSETGVPGHSFGSSKYGRNSDRFASCDECRSLSRRDPHSCPAVATRATAHEDHIEICASIFLDQFRERFKKQSIVPAVTREGELFHHIAIPGECDGGTVSGGLENQNGWHAAVSDFKTRNSNPNPVETGIAPLCLRFPDEGALVPPCTTKSNSPVR